MWGARSRPLWPSNLSTLSLLDQGLMWLAIRKRSSLIPVIRQHGSTFATRERNSPWPTRALINCIRSELEIPLSLSSKSMAALSSASELVLEGGLDGLFPEQSHIETGARSKTT